VHLLPRTDVHSSLSVFVRKTEITVALTTLKASQAHVFEYNI